MEKVQITLPPELLKKMDAFIEKKKPITGLDRSQYIRELIIADLVK